MDRELLQALELDRDPFLGPVGVDGYYTSPALAQRLDMSHHLTQYSELLICVSGAVGSGRTAFLEQFVHNAGSHWRIAATAAEQALGVGQLLGWLLDELGITIESEDVTGDGHGTERQLHALAVELEQRGRAGELTVIVIDDADRLRPNARELMVQLAARSDGLQTRIVMAGERGLADELQVVAQQRELGDLVYHLELPVLDEHTVADYVHRRLHAAGFAGESPFSDEVLEAILQKSAGVPAAVNAEARVVLADCAIAHGRRTARQRFGYQLGRWAKALMSTVVGLLIVAAIIWFVPPGDDPQPEQSADTPQPALETPRPPGAVQQPESKAITSVSSPKPVNAFPPAVVPVPVQPISPAGSSDERQSQSNQPSNKPSNGPLDNALTASAQRPRPPAPSTATTPTSVPAAGSKTQPSDRAKSAQTPKPAPKPPAVPESSSETAPKVVPKRPKVVEKSKSKKRSTGILWLREQSPERFTLQLVASSNLDAVKDHLSRSGLSRHVAIVTSKREGRPWYVLVYGSFSTRERAASAADELPASIRRGKPWPRTIGSLR